VRGLQRAVLERAEVVLVMCHFSTTLHQLEIRYHLKYVLDSYVANHVAESWPERFPQSWPERSVCQHASTRTPYN